MQNPLLTHFYLPPFSKIRAEDILPAIKTVINECREQVENLIAQKKMFTWDNLCQPLAEADDRLSRVWSPISHLNSVKNNTDFRAAYEQSLSLLSEYSTWIGQNEKLYEAYLNLESGAHFSELSAPQRKSVENQLRDFRLSGIGLEPEAKKRYAEIVASLSELSSAYSNHVLDASMGWTKQIDDLASLTGLPQSALSLVKMQAEAKQKKGALLTLDMPCYLPVITYADNRQLRQEIYEAYSTRASDQGPHAGQWDNSEIMEKILALRHELAHLLGFANYAEKSLSTKMAEKPEQVRNFLEDLAKLAYPKAEKELTQLRTFAKAHYGVDELYAWDIAYYSEKQKQHLYAISDEELKPYFPEQRVLEGLFEVTRRIYGIQIKECHDIDTWHPDVRFFKVLNEKNNEHYGSFYLDLYAREHKRAGAWMDQCVDRLRFSDGHLQKPVTYLVCNFSRPVEDKPALFTHDEVTILFHEFGHGLHHMLTTIETAGISGIHGVPRDAVELPSQFMENWCWQSEALAFISGHYETAEPLPEKMLNKLLSAKNYQSALFIIRQLEFALFDFCVHHEYDPVKGTQVLAQLREVKKRISVIPTPLWNRFPHSFTHIFSGGYAVGYYGYLWAEVLAADAFSRFEKEGIFNPKTGQSFLEEILSKGGSEEPMVLFKRFLGREPKSEAMLRSYGIWDK